MKNVAQRRTAVPMSGSSRISAAVSTVKKAAGSRKESSLTRSSLRSIW